MPLVVARQNVLSAVVRLGATANGAIPAATSMTIKLPPNAMIVGGAYRVVTGATGTTPTLSMVDSAAVPNTLLSAVAIGVADVGGIIDEPAEIGNFYPSGTTLSFTVGGTTPAVGDVLVVVSYIVVGRSDEIYGTDV